MTEFSGITKESIFLTTTKLKAESLGMTVEYGCDDGGNWMDFKGGTDEQQTELALWLDENWGHKAV